MTQDNNVPLWMNNSGYIEDEYSFTASSTEYTQTLPCEVWSAMVKADGTTTFTATTDVEGSVSINLIGVSASRPRHSVPISFYVTDSTGKIVSRAENIAYIASANTLCWGSTFINNLAVRYVNCGFVRIKLR